MNYPSTYAEALLEHRYPELIRHKLFTFINVIGLSLGIAIFLSLTGYVNYQFSFDKFYKDGDRSTGSITSKINTASPYCKAHAP